MPDAAPQPTSSRNRYGGHFATWPSLDERVAASCVMPPSRPMDAPVAMLMMAEMVLTNSVRNGSRPSPATTTSSRLVEPCGPTMRNPRYSTRPAANPPIVGMEIAFPTRQALGDLHGIARLDQMDRVIEKQIDQSADDADEAGEHEVERLLLEHQLLAQLQRAAPVPPEKLLRLRDQAAVQPRLHAANLSAKRGSDEGGFLKENFYAASVVVATKRCAMLSTMTPKPSSVRTPSNVISPGSAKTTSSASRNLRAQNDITNIALHGLLGCGVKGAFPSRRTPIFNSTSAGSHVNSEPVSTSASSGGVACSSLWDCRQRC